MVIVDKEGKIVLDNTQTETLFRYKRDELLGQAVEILIPERYRDKHPTHRMGYTTDPRLRPMGAGLELYALRSDGTEFPVEISLSPIETAEGVLVASSIRDITGRKLGEENIKKLNAELEHRANELQTVNKELEAFSYSVSHDLRAPIRAIDGFSRILLGDFSDKLDEEGKRFLSVIRKNTQNMGQLIDDLLAFSRLGRQEVKPSEIDMSGLAKTIFEELKSTNLEQTIQLNINSLPHAHGDRAMIRQVFVNLLSNAIKFSRKKERSVIEVRGWVEEIENVYYVKDNGVGFDMNYVDKLFGVFQRLHSQGEFEGTGVGLALVQRIIHRHGGRVWAEGKVGEGAAFYFTLSAGERA
jgi:PAS domain S-box-containing protein